jgi:hypothetical protein
LQEVINHFDNYPRAGGPPSSRLRAAPVSLITQKLSDFILWKKVIQIKEKKQHLSLEGLQAIINLKASINLGLSDQVTEAFSDIQPVHRPLVLDRVMKDPQ